MASYTTKIQSIESFSGAASGSISGQVVDTGNTFAATTTTFAAGSSGAALTMAFVKANLQSFFLLADQNCTVKTNSNSSPQDTISLVAGVPYFWSKSGGLTNPFGGDVTGAFVTCTPATTVKYGILQS